MNLKLTKPEDLAEEWGITVERLHTLRKYHGWPYVRLSRTEVRFTDEQIAEIIASRTVAAGSGMKAAKAGLSKRSAARSA